MKIYKKLLKFNKFCDNMKNVGDDNMHAMLERNHESEFLYTKHLSKVLPFSTLFHKHIEIFSPTTHSGFKTQINGKDIVLNKGDIHIVFPYIAHSNCAFPHPADIILVDPDIIPAFRDVFLSKYPENPVIRHGEVPSATFLMEKIIGMKNGEFSYDIVRGYLTALLGEILESLSLTESERCDSTSLQKILLFCTENYNQDINIDTVAKNVHVSKSYVTHVFTKKLGYSFRKFLNDLRIDNAKKLLVETNMSVTDIMFECGYQNQSTFNKAFIERCGMVPLMYRKSASVKKE